MLILGLWLLPAGSLLESRFIEPTTTEAAIAIQPPQTVTEESAVVQAEVVITPTPTPTVHIPRRSATPSNDLRYKWMHEAGIPISQQDCANTLIARESGWRVQAINLSSGSYGLPQSVPAHKMASAGSDWETNPITQLRWMISYVDSRYGGFCQALEHSNSHNWY